MVHYLTKLKTEKILNNTIVIFLSDHGMRFGEIRKFLTGYIEDYCSFGCLRRLRKNFPI